MATILTPGEDIEIIPPTELTELYLKKDNYLSEFLTDGEKSVVRENLNVYSKDSVYNKTESLILLDNTIQQAFNKYLDTEDPHGILPVVDEKIKGMVKDDGSTPFLYPQKGVDPVLDFHLTTKRFVTKLLKEHINSEDPHRIIPEVEDMLEQYVKQSLIYFKNLLYTKDEIDKQNTKYLKGDGTTPFIKPLIGADPQIDSHLSTKRYVDLVMYKHLVDVDPHGFISILNKRLASYAKLSNVYDKTLTYSRTQVDSIIRNLVYDAAEEALADHLNEVDPHNVLDEVRKLKYVKLDGTVPFKAPQKGQDAIDPQDLVTLHQVEEKIEGVTETIKELPEPIWITSGPVESTVGHVEDDSILPEKMTLQEIMDAIFYGKGISLDVPDYVTITEKCPVTMCIHGSTGLIERAELYQNGELIYSFLKEEFEDGCITVDSLPLLEDTEFVFKVYYTNGSVHEESKTVHCYMPVFVGLLPKWKFGNTVTMDYLIELCKEDIEGTQNRFLNQGGELTSFSFYYKFKDPNQRHPFIVLPYDYPDLDTLVTSSLSFGVDAFDVINMIPLSIPGVEKDVIYKIYIYKQALSSLNLKLTFNFIPKSQHESVL